MVFCSPLAREGTDLHCPPSSSLLHSSSPASLFHSFALLPVSVGPSPVSFSRPPGCFCWSSTCLFQSGSITCLFQFVLHQTVSVVVAHLLVSVGGAQQLFSISLPPVCFKFSHQCFSLPAVSFRFSYQRVSLPLLTTRHSLEPGVSPESGVRVWLTIYTQPGDRWSPSCWDSPTAGGLPAAGLQPGGK